MQPKILNMSCYYYIAHPLYPGMSFIPYQPVYFQYPYNSSRGMLMHDVFEKEHINTQDLNIQVSTTPSIFDIMILNIY